MRLRSLLAATGLLATTLVTAAAPATAAGTCSAYVPSRISVGQYFKSYRINEGPNCASAGVVYASWDGVHPTQGQQDILIFNGTRSTDWDVYDWNVPLGRWTWRPGLAYDSSYDDVYQYTTYTDVRLASYGRVTATRSGSKVNIKTTARRYWTTESRFIGWAGARGQIQWRTPGSSTWHGLKDVYSNSAGAYSYTYSTTASRDYRVVLNPVSTIWGSTSPSVRR